MQLGQRLKHSLSMGNKHKFSQAIGNKINENALFHNKNMFVKSQPQYKSPLER